MRKAALVTAVLLATLALHAPARAQSLTFSLFDRYLDSLREQAGIPGMTAVITQDGVIVWERTLGRQNIETATPTTFETAYPIGGLSQTIGSTLLLRTCIDQSYARLSDRVVRWDPTYPEPATTLQALLTHTSPAGTFQYSPARFAALTSVIEQCTTSSYSRVAADEIFDQLGMTSTVPGQGIAPRAGFDAADVERYERVLQRVAVPYRVDRGRSTRSEILPADADAAGGIVSTARDLSRFDAALGSDRLLQRATRTAAWTRQSAGSTVLPTGLGWFVQNYQGQLIVWQFGTIPNAYSSFIIKAPNRGVTLILLANSDGLTGPYGLENGDVTTSLFAQLFLKLLVP